MTGYIGIGGTARKVKNLYFGVGNTARKVKKAYIGVNGVAQLWYSSGLSLAQLFAGIYHINTYESHANSLEGKSFSLGAAANFQNFPYYYIYFTGRSLQIYRLNAAGPESDYSLCDFDLLAGSGSDLLQFYMYRASIFGSYRIYAAGTTETYNCSLYECRFPDFVQADVDELLSSLTVTQLAGRANTTNGTVVWTTPDIKANALYLAATVRTSSPYVYMSISSGADFLTPIWNPRENLMYLRRNPNNGRYQLCIQGPTGTAATQVPVGGIYELS